MAFGLFVGLTTLDFIYLTPGIPQPNQKLVAIDAMTAAGGPATNASVTFQALGNQSRLLSAIGQHSSSSMIREDLKQLELRDLAPDRMESPPISSILVTQSTGDRAIISMNATRFQAEALSEALLTECLTGIDIVLVDGHQMAMSVAIVQLAKSKGIPVVMDGGSWKEGFDTLLPYIDYAICSSNFLPPNCTGPSLEEILDYLANFGISNRAITRGAQEIVYCDRQQAGSIPVPQVRTIDTLGAGDIFHGAFCHFILQQSFPIALSNAAKVAAQSCQQFGTRSWLSTLNSPS